MKNQTIETLRKAGNTVNVTHYRFVRSAAPVPAENDMPVLLPMKAIYEKNISHLILAKGGKVVVTIQNPENATFIGESKCVITDAYRRKFGMHRALGRAVSKMVNAVES